MTELGAGGTTKGDENMTDDERNQIEALNELINGKLAADEADSGWVVALIMVQVLPVLKQIAGTLEVINKGIAPDEAGRSVAGELRLILNALAALAAKTEPRS
jgi:hypothetical protein